MIYGTGIDITDLDRVAHAVEAQPVFLTKVLTPAEVAIYQTMSGSRAVEFIGGRWSAKESFSKAMGTGIGRAVGFQDLEILDDQAGRPYFNRHPFDGAAFISISHTATMVMTQVILEKGNGND
ncbi:holo-ACP synthase [Levilactobacillus bambusae]|uniref:Holo-[acyl-carrier-protein] synthase n=1 Tax=Levilactobacillus bambusae TaxID=2024736 RepID=A0A2V1MXN6_9LACO|nr:holo-ACP synthase [Levilactobacillus bambusae]PWF99307.1 holo-ACP synthase [Levilactobacillus bambusae]